MWNSKEKFLAVSILKCSPISYEFLQFLFPLPSKRPLHSLWNSVQFMMGTNAHVFNIFKDNTQTMSDKFCICCLMFDEMSVRRLTVFVALMTLEGMAGQAILHIMPWFSLFMVYMKSGSNQYISIWFMEALRERRLLFSWRRFLILGTMEDW